MAGLETGWKHGKTAAVAKHTDSKVIYSSKSMTQAVEAIAALKFDPNPQSIYGHQYLSNVEPRDDNTATG